MRCSRADGVRGLSSGQSSATRAGRGGSRPGGQWAVGSEQWGGLCGWCGWGTGTLERGAVYAGSTGAGCTLHAHTTQTTLEGLLAMWAAADASSAAGQDDDGAPRRATVPVPCQADARRQPSARDSTYGGSALMRVPTVPGLGSVRTDLGPQLV